MLRLSVHFLTSLTFPSLPLSRLLHCGDNDLSQDILTATSNGHPCVKFQLEIRKSVLGKYGSPAETFYWKNSYVDKEAPNNSATLGVFIPSLVLSIGHSDDQKSDSAFAKVFVGCFLT